MSLQEDKINKEIKSLINIRGLIQSCDAVSIIRQKDNLQHFIFNKDDFSDFDKDIIDCMVAGLSEKVRNLLEKRKTIREEQQNDGHSQSN